MTFVLHGAAAPACTKTPRRRSGAFAVLSLIGHWRAVRRQRRRLLTLDAHLLRDIGMTAREAADEADRAPWDVPRQWRRDC